MGRRSRASSRVLPIILSIFSGPVTSAAAEVLDLSLLEPHQLEPLFREELRAWRERLLWDLSGSFGALRGVLEQRALAGKAVRAGGRLVGYAYYLVEGGRALVGGVTVSPEADAERVGPALVDAVLTAMESEGRVTRWESQFISFGAPWLGGCFRAKGFEEYGRLFLRRSVETPSGTAPAAGPDGEFLLEAWSEAVLTEAVDVLRRAHLGRIDARINALYRTRQGCQILLDNVVRQRGCGSVVPSASCLVRERATGALSGFVLASETSPAHAHLAQVAVAPQWHGRGLGQLMVLNTLNALALEGFRTASLMVSRDNHQALALYRRLGFELVLEFPVFAREKV
jgi:ribosomal protein S18 acetylase RimI-like enzyme